MKSVAHYVEAFQPENYKLFLEINRKEKTFTGAVAITGLAAKEQISLHQKDLLINSVKFDGQDLGFQMDHENEAVHIIIGETGNVVLELAFSGQITDNMTGMYPSYYTFEGQRKDIISSQFESHFAREVFPSVDEPEAKATFDLSLSFDQEEGDIALSNMPEIKVEERKKTGVWTFDTTPRMSSYLLAFVLGALHGKSATTKKGTLVGSYATQAQRAAALDFSLDMAVRVIEFYEDYFQVHYPIPQCLHVALPDFSAGAMENWGLITYREVYLLVDENSSVASRQQVALVVAHEVAHQWFGNLVTMKWWDDLWLNESFANMMEYVAIDTIEPSWNIFEDFQTSGVPHALRRDATDGVQSVHVQVKHPDEINTLFDAAIVYAKGSRLMHMLRRWLGDEAFSTGLKAYFDKHQYDNTIGRDLWDALSAASGKDVASFMDAWLEQPGYPLISIKVEDDKLILSQKQFFIGEHEAKGRLWPVPLNSNWIGLPDALSQEHLVIENYSQLAVANQDMGPLRLNTGNTAHYITDYQGQLLQGLLANISHLDTSSKLQVLEERRLLAEGGQISFADLVPLLGQLKDDRSYLVASAAEQLIFSLQRFLDEDSHTEQVFKRIVRSVFQSNFDRLGFEKVAGESDEDEMVRQVAINAMLWADDAKAIDQAREIFGQYEDRIESIPAPIRAFVLANQMKHAGSIELVESYLESYAVTSDSNFQGDLGHALSFLKSDEGLDRILSVLKDKDVVKPQNLAAWYATFLRRPFAQKKMWIWACQDWDWIKKALGGDMAFDAFVIIPSDIFKTKERLDEYKDFFEPQLSDIALSRNIAMGIKAIAARVQLIEKEKKAVEKAISGLQIH